MSLLVAPPAERGDELVDVLVLRPDVDEQILEPADRSHPLLRGQRGQIGWWLSEEGSPCDGRRPQAPGETFLGGRRAALWLLDQVPHVGQGGGGVIREAVD
jgi:hypothetical protein